MGPWWSDVGYVELPWTQNDFPCPDEEVDVTSNCTGIAVRVGAEFLNDPVQFDASVRGNTVEFLAGLFALGACAAREFCQKTLLPMLLGLYEFRPDELLLEDRNGVNVQQSHYKHGSKLPCT